MNNTTYKVCNMCGVKIPATSEYFNKNKNNKDGLNPNCKKCTKEYNAKRYQEKKDKIKAQTKEYYENNKEKIKPFFKENKRRYYEKNIESYKQDSIKWREEHPEYFREYHKKYRIENPDKWEAIAKRRKDRVDNLPYTLTKEQWKYIKTKFDNRCCYCGKQLPLQRDHFVPVVNDGGFTIGNIVPACKRCNGKKNDGNYFEWYPKQDFYSEERMAFLLNHLDNIEQEWDNYNIDKLNDDIKII